MADGFGVGEEFEAIGADQDAGGEIAEHGSEAGGLGQRHEGGAGSQENEEGQQDIVFHPAGPA
jgi:hypothetical protein